MTAGNSSTAGTTLDAYIEAGKKRVFACVLDWPGWARSGRTDEDAIEALTTYRPRYEIVVARAGLKLPAAPVFAITERVTGTAGYTDFGVPGEQIAHDFAPVAEAEAARLAKLATAAWEVFDEVVAGAPAELRKGPRGGGRDRDAVTAHVINAEGAYVRKLGLKLAAPDPADPAAIASFRAAVVEVLGRPSDGQPVTPKGWPSRYAARRIIWHVLDHAWEIEDKSA